MDIKGKMQPIIGELETAIKNEYSAFYLYTAASAWCQITGYENAAKYFRREAETEIFHAQEIQDFMNNWGLKYNMPTVDTAHVFTSLPDIVQRLFNMMSLQYEAYEKSADLAFKVDKSAFQLFLGKVQTQYYAVTYYLTLIDKLKQIDPSDENWIINFEQEAFFVEDAPMPM